MNPLRSLPLTSPAHSADAPRGAIRRLAALLVLATLLAPTPGMAFLTFHDNILDFRAAVNGGSTAVGATQSLFIARNVLHLADEVTSVDPTAQILLGSVLTFRAENTGRCGSFTLRALQTPPGSCAQCGLSFDDVAEGGPAFDEMISIGDINDMSDDDFEFTFPTPAVYAVAFELIHNTAEAGETLTVYGFDGESVGSLSFPNIPSNPTGFAFIGIVSDEPIARVRFDEGIGGDDIAVFPITLGCANLDTDGDGLSNQAERKAGTNLLLFDTDGDSLGDGFELGTGTFGEARTVTDSPSYTSLPPRIRNDPIDTADLDLDGDLDVVSAEESATGIVAWYENRLDEPFADFAPQQPVGLTDVGDSHSIAIADVDGDNFPNPIAAPRRPFLGLDQNDAEWFENAFTPSGPLFTKHAIPAVLASHEFLLVTDLDKDADPDLVLTAPFNDHIAWHENNLGVFGASQQLSVDSFGRTPLDAVAADFDGDGDVDVASVFAAAGDADLRWHENRLDQTGGFAETIVDFNVSYLALAAADFDGDGDMDLVTAGPELKLWTNAGGQGFFSNTQLIALGGFQNVAAEDVDGDGDVDLVAAGTDRSLWLENSVGNATVWEEHEIESQILNLDEALPRDIDGDGDLDVLISADGSGFVNTSPSGCGTFVGASGAPGITNGWGNCRIAWYEQLAVGNPLLPDTDFDGTNDHLEDPDGDGWVTVVELFTYGTDPLSADTDADGLDDQVEISFGWNALSADTDSDGLLDFFEWRNFGSGSTAGPTDDPDGDGEDNLTEQGQGSDPNDPDSDGDGLWDGSVCDGIPTAPTCCERCQVGVDLDPTQADSDGDGMSDRFEVLAGFNPLNDDNNSNGIPDGFEDRDLDASGTVPVPDGLSSSAEDAAGLDPVDPDTDDDGLLDGQELGTGIFGGQRVITTNAAGAQAAIAADLDGDGDLDVISASFLDDRVAWYENRLDEPSADFGPQFLINAAFPAVNPVGVHAADVDGDGDMDVLSASTGDSQVAWYENVAGDGSSWTGRAISSTAIGAWSVVAADLDGDGDLDVAATENGSQIVKWYEHGGGRPGAANIRWQERGVVGLDGGPLVAADFNREGRTHLAAGATVSGRLALAGNDGTPDRGPWADVTVASLGGGSTVISPFPADVDSDGDLDMVFAAMGTGSIGWQQNQASQGSFPVFGPAQSIAAGAAGPRGIFAVDVDMDGDTDLVAALQTSGTIAWYENQALLGQFPSFGAAQPLSVLPGTFPVGVSAADLDGDGDTDVLAATFSDNTIAWYEQQNAADPLDADSDGDGLCDGSLAGGGTPLACPLDGEDLNANGQYDIGLETDPNLPDTDFDSFSDGLEVAGGSDPLDPGSTPPACSDGLDNDSDGTTDFPADMGCKDAQSNNEAPQCQDGVDNDGKLGTDFDGGEWVLGVGNGDPNGADPQCASFWDNKEAAASTGGTCGIGPELVVLLPLLGAWRIRRRRKA